MKSYQIRFTIAVHEKGTSYPEVKPIDLSITENLPANVDPQKHLRKRISEELARNFAAIAGDAIQNKDDNAPEDDPLGDDPF